MMDDVSFVCTTVSKMFGAGMRTTLAQRLVNPLFDRCFSLIKHVLTVWPLTSISACLVTKQCLMMFAVAKHFPFGQAFRGGISQKIG